jgi:hypothetical protein
MHILVSFCNGRIAAMPKLGLLDTATSQVQIIRLPTILESGVGVTGLARSEHHIYAVIQDGERHLAIFDRTTFALCALPPLPALADIHSLWFDGGDLYAVSTGTDEVVKLRLRGTEIEVSEVYWRPDPAGPREDRHHLNAIIGVRGELYVSGFGQKAGARWSSARDGFIFNMTEQRYVLSGIEHPHSLAHLGGSLAYCESRHSAVRILGEERSQQLPGYTRGMCVVGESLYVGTSLGRRVSKSTGLINNPDDPGALDGGCTISRLSVSSLAIEETIDLSSCGYEVYDLLPVKDVAAWPVLPTADWQRTQIRRFMVAMEGQRTASAPEVLASATADHRVALEALERELAETRQTFERRSAEAAATIARLQARLDEANRLINAMQATRLWRAGRLYWHVRDWFKNHIQR